MNQGNRPREPESVAKEARAKVQGYLSRIKGNRPVTEPLKALRDAKTGEITRYF